MSNMDAPDLFSRCKGAAGCTIFPCTVDMAGSGCEVGIRASMVLVGVESEGSCERRIAPGACEGLRSVAAAVAASDCSSLPKNAFKVVGRKWCSSGFSLARFRSPRPLPRPLVVGSALAAPGACCLWSSSCFSLAAFRPPLPLPRPLAVASARPALTRVCRAAEPPSQPSPSAVRFSRGIALPSDPAELPATTASEPAPTRKSCAADPPSKTSPADDRFLRGMAYNASLAG